MCQAQHDTEENFMPVDETVRFCRPCTDKQFLLGLQIIDDQTTNNSESESDKETNVSINGGLVVHMENYDDNNNDGDDEMPNIAVDSSKKSLENADSMSDRGNDEDPITVIDDSAPISIPSSIT